MVTQNNNHPPSCPTCEFTHGERGNPYINADGTMICNTCNSRWRELAGNTAADEISKNSSDKYPGQSTGSLQLSAISRPFSGTMPKPFASGQSGTWSYSSSPGLFLSGLVAVLLTLLVYRYYPFPETIQVARNTSIQLTLDNVKIENVKNLNIPVWIVSARISNNSAHLLPVPPILIHSGTKGSSGYFGWTVKPALQKLAPGSNLIIRTSVQKPVGSSQEIELEFVGGNLNSG